MPVNHVFAMPGAEAVDVDAALGDAPRRHVRLLRQHRRGVALGHVALALRDLVGAVDVAEVRGVDGVLRHLLQDRADRVARLVVVGELRRADLVEDGDVPQRRDVVGVVPREDEVVRDR